MKAAMNFAYGGPEVVSIGDIDQPTPKAGEILVQVAHSSVTTADWRLRAAQFPGILAVPARLMFGISKPRKAVLGSDFAGTIAALGDGVDEFAVGQRVFGSAMHGAHAEYLMMPAFGAVVSAPSGVDFADVAAVPFGGASALEFVRDFAGVKPGQHVLIVGASGGVGAYGVQIAKALGAKVTGVASTEHEGFVRDLGADAFIDYRTEDVTKAEGPFDAVIDTVGAVHFRQIRPLLTPKGVFVPLNFGMREIGQALCCAISGRQKVRIGVSGDTKENLQILVDWMDNGTLKPVVDSRFALADIQDAYRRVEKRHRRGAVLLDIAP